LKYTLDDCCVKIVLVGPEYERNIGAIARLMKNFGFSDLRIVSTKTRVGSEAIAYAMHGADLLRKAKFYPDLEKALADIDFVVGTSSRRAGDDSNLSRMGIELAGLQSRIANVGNAALVFGRESKGLSKKELDLCDTVLTICANPAYPVLNIASSAAIIFHNLHGQSFQAKASWSYANNKVKRKIVEYFMEIMDVAQYPQRKRRLAVRALKNVMGRSSITRREASLLVGVLRRAGHILRHGAGGKAEPIRNSTYQPRIEYHSDEIFPVRSCDPACAAAKPASTKP